METKQFIFSIADLKREAEKRTSYLGKMRAAEGQSNLYERVALTEGEAFLSEEYLREAAAETYDWIKAFGRGIDNAYRYLPDGGLTALSEYFGAGIVLFSGQRVQSVSLPLSTGKYTISEKTAGYEYTIPLGYNISTGTAAAVKYRITVLYTVGVPNTPFTEQRKQQAEPTNGSAVLVDYTNTVPYESSNLGDVELQSIDQIDIEIIGFEPIFPIAEGNYVSYTDSTGKTIYGVAQQATQYDGYSLPRCDWYEKDMRNAIVYTLGIPDWQDQNMLRKAENDLREALVNYLIWRWLETVLPSEADTYEAKWEEKAHGAQLALNTESQVLQRRVVWL